MRKAKHYFGRHRRRRGKRSSLPRWMKLWVKFTIADLSGVLLTPIERDPNPPVVTKARFDDYELDTSAPFGANVDYYRQRLGN